MIALKDRHKIDGNSLYGSLDQVKKRENVGSRYI